MRLTTRYFVFCAFVVLFLCTYEIYIYSESAKKYLVKNFHKKLDVISSGRPGRKKFELKSNRKGTRSHDRDSIKKKHSFLNVTLTAEEFRQNPNLKTGNPLIDSYGHNDLTKNGELGRGLTFVGAEKRNVSESMRKYFLNVVASDLIPLNRLVPDSRPPNCKSKTYRHDLPTTSVIIPFYDEWPSILVRTVYSIINRTPRHLLQEIILVDDASTMSELKEPLDWYIKTNFPTGLIKIIHVPTRQGLIKARLKGWKLSKGEVVVFFDSHMEVNLDWLQPLLTEIKINRKTVAMGVLDYINSETFEYRFNEGYMTRYGFDWRLVFFETFFRQDQIGPSEESTRPGTVMVGAAYAIDSKYFGEIGTYDEGMKVWGGENLEMAWRVWMCGGRLVHLPCSHLGHIARSQPYDFPGGRRNIEVFNYKRAIEVWMEPEHKQFVYDHFEDMQEVNVGDLTDRIALKKRLNCKTFSWFIENIWPELHVFNKDVFAWGSARNLQNNMCLDNHQYLFQAPEALFAEVCHYKLSTQGFSWTREKLLRTSLQCVVLKEFFEGAKPKLEDCIIGPRDTWMHEKSGFLKHEKTGLCLDVDATGPVMRPCRQEVISQKWQFNQYNY